MSSDLISSLRLFRTDGIGPVTWRRLLADYGSAAAALEALPERAARAGRRRALSIPDEETVTREIERVTALGGHILTLHDPLYPPLLAEIPDSPPVLTVMGNLACLSARSVGIVGARNASAAGMRFTENLATELSGHGLTVVSGLARGIDGAAHRGALHGAFPEWGSTAAAIAGGIDVVYPPEHKALQEKIAAEGALITEAPLGTMPQARHFPRRNRLIAGLSLGTVVVEAAMNSGSLITADLAEGYSRAVFAVPGSPLDPRCRGSNNLLRTRQAWLVEGMADILPHLRPDQPAGNLLFPGFSEQQEPWAGQGRSLLPGLDSLRRQMLSLISYTPVPVDDLVRHCQVPVSAVLTVLTELELAGRVELLPGGAVVLLVPAGTE